MTFWPTICGNEIDANEIAVGRELTLGTPISIAARRCHIRRATAITRHRPAMETWRIAWVLLSILVVAHGVSVRGQGYPPSDVQQHLAAAAGLRVTLMAHEPDVRQCIFVKCDDRGRLWTIQYLQYPNPAGLDRIATDRWSRSQYDRLPAPPPNGPRGADKITIVEDRDGDGRAETFHDFATGLNLVTGLAFGNGGVYVLNVPYLLFFPDTDRDDIPDGDPRVLLTGFGMEDAQSLSNHLTWGPDGWLYGVNGSTTTCRIRGVEFQQGVWRYHPRRDRFELFCEGGSNCYGVTFDRHGNLFYSTNGGPFVDAVQGGYYFKSFGKHGPLHNRFAYHFFANLECDLVPGGPPTGGTIYREQLLPSRFHDRFLAGNFLGRSVSAWSIEPIGSTVRAKFQEQLFQSDDTWCGPTDLCVGPDGTVYIADFFDQRTAHPDPDAVWDRSNGRIYRIDVPGHQTTPQTDIRTCVTDELLAMIRKDGGWQADRARLELSRRRDRGILPQLDVWARQVRDGGLALRALWTRYGVAELPDQLATDLLVHPNADVRRWVVRLIADHQSISIPLARQLSSLARRETTPIVRLQLAASARRLPAPVAIDLITILATDDSALDDERLFWSLWWALEHHANSGRRAIVTRCQDRNAWQSEALATLNTLLVRRYAADGRGPSYDAAYGILRSAPHEKLDAMHESLRQGFSERGRDDGTIGQGGLFEDQARVDQTDFESHRSFEPVSGALLTYLLSHWRSDQDNPVRLALALQAGIPAAQPHLVDLIARSTATGKRVDRVLLDLLANHGGSESSQLIVAYLEKFPDEPSLRDALPVLRNHASDAGEALLLARYLNCSPETQRDVRSILFSRAGAARRFLTACQAGRIAPESIPLTEVARLALHHDLSIDRFVREIWGRIGPGTPEEKLATMRRFSNDLRAGTGDIASGKALFQKQCGVCHRLFGEGGTIGPDLTNTSRQDRAALLASLVDPSAIVRRNYVSQVIHTTGGQVVTGIVGRQTAAEIALFDSQGKEISIRRDAIDQIEDSSVSLMPERLLDPLTPQQLRDLFAYLQRAE